MNITARKLLVGVVVALLPLAATMAKATELSLLSPIALEPVLRVLLPEYEYLNYVKVKVAYATAGAVAQRVTSGEAVDVAITSAPLAQSLLKQGQVSNNVPIARVGVGMFVRKGSPRPDIGSAEAFRRALLQARSIGYVDPALGGPAGVHMAEVVKRLGLDLGSRVKLFKVEDRFLGVLHGEADIGFNQISEILAEPGVDFVGPLPATFQNYTSFVAGVTARSRQRMVPVD